MKLCAFTEWTVDQVSEAALRLYALRPFPIDSEGRWKALVRDAYRFLDKVGAAQIQIAEERRQINVAYRRSEARSETDLPDPVPYDKAVRFITHEQRTDRAKPKLAKFVRCYPEYFFGVTGNKVKAREHGPHGNKDRNVHDNKVHMLIKRWHKNGMSRQEALQLQHLFEEGRRTSNRNRQNAKQRKRRGAATPTL
jgi:hypothetical protein